MPRVPRSTFLNDHTIRYFNKEYNCGSEGWLEVSEDGKPFKRRFCYVQDHPSPRFVYASNATTQEMLESLSLRNKLEFTVIDGKDIVSVYNGHTAAAFARKKQRSKKFQIKVQAPTEGKRRLTETRLGLISGIVDSASGLKSSGHKGVPVAVPVEFVADVQDDGDADIDAEPERALEPEPKDLTEEPEDPTDAWSTLDRIVIEEEDEQTQIAPTRYMATRRAVVRSTSSTGSEQTAVINSGEVRLVTHTKQVGQILRLRTAAGWVSAKSSQTGGTIMIAENAPNSYYRLKRATAVDAFKEISRCVEQEPLAQLGKKTVVEVLESTTDTESLTTRLRVKLLGGQEGWISEVDLSASAPPTPSCVVSVLPHSSGTEDSKQRKKGEDAFVPKRQMFATKPSTEAHTPSWGERFQMGVFASFKTLLIRVVDEVHGTDMGSAEITLSDEEGVPLGSSVLCGGVRLQIAERGTELNLELVDAAGARAGSVRLLLCYRSFFSQPELLAARQKAGNVPDFISAMLVPEIRNIAYRFQCTTTAQRRLWLAVARWVASGVPRRETPRMLTVPVPELTPTEMKRAERDVSLVDLPFSRIGALMQGLYHRRVMGKRKPTLRRMVVSARPCLRDTLPLNFDYLLLSSFVSSVCF
eukprot:SAG11_NODE_2053_length_3878_cov_2.361207_2_plen_641_part_00